MTYSYTWWDDARQAQLKFDTNTATTSDAIQTSTFAYDVNGRLTYVNIQDGRPRNVTFITDVNGQVLRRTEADNNASLSDPKDVYYYFGGVRVGEVTNNPGWGDGYAWAVSRRTLKPSSTSTPFITGNAAGVATDFGQAYESLTPGSVRNGASAYTVRDGDTLQGIAAAVWGDASLWYMIAEANGLTSANPLVAGQTLSIPGKVANVHNTADTFRPYDPNKAMGDVSPTQPKPVANAGKKGCGVVGQIIAVVIAVVVTYVSQGAMGEKMAAMVSSVMGAGKAATAVAATVTAAASAAAGSTAGQAFLVATGAQDNINWKQVGISALTAGVNQGVGGLNSVNNTLSKIPGPTWVQEGVRGAGLNALTQGVSVAVGLQDRFDWTGVAVAGVVRGVGSTVSNALPPAAAFSRQGLVNSMVSGTVSAVAGAGVRSLIAGTSFGDNLQSVLPDVIGQTIGNMVAGGIQEAQQAAQRSRYLRDETEALIDRPEFQDTPIEQRRHAAGSLANNDEMQGRRYGETAGVLNADGYSTLAESSRLALSPDALPGERLTGLANHLYHVNGLSEDEVRFVVNDFAKSDLMDVPYTEGVVEFADNRWVVKAPSAFGEGWIDEDGQSHLPDVLVEMRKLGTVYGMPLTDGVVSNAGGVVHRVQQTIQENPALGYGLMAIDVLTGPTTFVVSGAIEASPVGAFVERKVGEVRDYFTGLYEGVSYDATTSRNGGTGTLTLGMLAAGLGARRTLRALDIQMPMQRGRTFERNAIQSMLGHIGVGKNTRLIPVTMPDGTVVRTIPDAFGRSMGVVEFKDVAEIGSSRQLRAQLEYAEQNRMPFNLVVSPNTRHISQPLLRDISAVNERFGGGVYRYDPAIDTLTDWPSR
ncbi:hypothetical protein GCM10017620_31180 [Brevundimonas intermedia]|uniref:LysM domain-containing protein n=1 Tax=Brevundimonas intermedia TaxID=74315 RepID=A0ABQ5TDT1_9CAUL|nr:putative toxin [Brevundimonas intermedia]GLK50144.1 hypothetical protein GCM10017620_31180 [Brevundimonas intermedia]